MTACAVFCRSSLQIGGQHATLTGLSNYQTPQGYFYFPSHFGTLPTPRDYVYLLFIAVWGKILFDQWTTGQALIGIILIAVAGVFIAWRESVYKGKSIEN